MVHPSSDREDVIVNQTSQRQLGDTDSPIEDELEDAFIRMVDEGAQRLHRSWREVVVTGFFGGTEVAMGVLAYLSVLHATNNDLLAGLAFSIGFLALLLGRSELFTEGFLVPVTAMAAKRASFGQLLKLWSGTLAGNLAGGWVLMWLIGTAFPKLQTQTVASATHYATAPLSAESLSLAVLGGMVITLMTRMQHGTDSVTGKIAAAVAGAFLLAGLQMFHSILGLAAHLRCAAHREGAVRLPRLARLVRLHRGRQCPGRTGPGDAAAPAAQQGPTEGGARRRRSRVRHRSALHVTPEAKWPNCGQGVGRR